MADPNAPADTDPFEQIMSRPEGIDPDAVDNPFAKIMPKAIATPSSTLGAVGRGAMRSALPAIGSLPAIGAGAEFGAVAGGAIGGPFAPATAAVGGVIGGFAGAMLGSTAVAHAQNWALSKMPDSWREAIGMDDRQEKIDQGEHPIASFLGGLVPFALTMRPGASTTTALPENATAMQRIMAHPATARVFGGAAMGGMELGQEAAHGESPDWTKVAISTGFGMVFNKPTKLGERLIESGASPTRAAMGRNVAPIPTVAEAGDAKVAGPGITESVFMGTQQQDSSAAMTAQDAARAERATLREPPAPDLHAVARRMEPEVFDQYDQLTARRDQFRNWIAEHNNPPEETIKGLADQRAALEQQLQEHVTARGGYQSGAEARQMRAQIRTIAAEEKQLSDRAAKFAAGEAEETPELAAARQHLMATDFELRDVGRQVAAAYRRAADAVGGATVEGVPHVAPEEVPAAVGQPERRGATLLPNEEGAAPQVAPEVPSAALPLEPGQSSAAPVPEAGQPAATAPQPGQPAAKPIAEQKAAIAADVARQLIAAGRPADEAQASGQLIAARYTARAARMGGELGSAEELYRREGADIRGPNGRAPPAAPVAAPATRQELADFVKSGGEVAPNPARVAEAKLVSEFEPGPGPKAEPEPEIKTVDVRAKAPRGPRARDPETWSLMEFLADRGGITPNEKNIGDLRTIFGKKNQFVPGFGQLIREGGMTLDKAREAAKEAGYFHDQADIHGGTSEMTIQHLLDALDTEARGQKQYRLGAKVMEQAEDPAVREHQMNGALDEALTGAEIKPSDVTGKVRERTLEIMDKEGVTDPLAAWDRAVMEQDEHGSRSGDIAARTESIPGWDVPDDAGPTHGSGKAVAHEQIAKGEGAGEAARTAGQGDEGQSSEVIWNRFVENRADRNITKPIATGFNDLRTRAGNAPLRQRSSQEWTTGNVIDVGFVKNLLISSKEPDGSFRLLAKPDADGISQSYTIKPQEGLSKDARINFVEATKNLTGAAHPAIRDELEYFQRPAQTDTPEFKRWFGDSKVVDAEGKPQVVYHGTDKNFRSFNTKKATQGIIWFTSDKGAIEAGEVGAQGRGKILDLYASLKNPAGWEEYDKLSLGELKARGYDGAILPDGDGKFTGFAFEPTQLKSASKNSGAFDPANPRLFEQSARGKINIAEGRRPIITLMRDANESTFIHETGHQWLEELIRDAHHEKAPNSIRDDADTVLSWLGAKSAEGIKTRHHEKFARGFEQYMREGVAPSPELAGVFAKFKQWLITIYNTVKSLGKPINDDIKQVFDRLLAEDPQRTVIAPEREGGPTLHDIHEADAAHTEPHEAAPAADRVAAERERYVSEPPPEIAHEIAPVVAEIESAAAARAGAERSGEDGGGAGRLPEVEPSRGETGTKPGSGGMGKERGPLGNGRNEIEGKGGSVPGNGESRSDAQLDAGHPLAPRPATLFGPDESPFIDKAGNIRLDNLTARDDVANAIRQSAEANNNFIGDRRGVVTDGQVMELADALGMTFEKLQARKVGQAFNAEQIMAARKLLVESATNVSELMKRAANGSDADVVAYAQARDRHHMIQGQVAGLTAEWGRAGRAFRDISMSPEAQNVDQFLKGAVGKTLFQLRREAQLGMVLETPQQISKFMRDAQERTFGRMMLEYWINGLLSGPTTHVTNGVSNLLLTMQHFTVEAPVAAAIGKMRASMGREGEFMRVGEIGAALKGFGRAAPAGAKAAGESLVAGSAALLPGEIAKESQYHPGAENAVHPVVDEATKAGDLVHGLFGFVRGLRDGIISTAALIKAGGEAGAPAFGTSYSLTGTIPDFQIKGVTALPLGSAVRLPGRFLAAADAFSRTTNYAMAKSSLAYRQASTEGLTGHAFDARVADLIQNPPPQMMEAARDTATDLTLMSRTSPFVTAVNRLANTEILGFPVAKFILPFVNIAGNIIEQAVLRRSPVGLLSPELRADLMGRNGNIAQDTAMARMLVGTGVSTLIGTLAAQGYVSGSGPTDRGEAAVWRMAGNQPHSIRIGDIWYDASRLGPLGMMIGIAADLYTVQQHVKDDEYSEAAGSFLHAVTQNVLDQSFMKGPADLIQALEDSDRYGQRYIQNSLSAFVPYSVGMGQIARANDPYMRQARTVTDSLIAKIPGLSTTLFPKRDIWGEPMPNKEALIGTGFTAIYETHVSKDPVNIAMLDLGVTPAPVTRKIRGVDLTDEQYDDFSRLSGRMTKQRLNVIVRSADWQTWPPHIKRAVVEAELKADREIARGYVMAKYPQIIRDATIAKREKFED